MALDGITVSNIVSELKKIIVGGHTDKIYQPLKDEIILSVRSKGKALKIILSANPSHPRIHITNIQRDNPITAPMFCMVLRKYLSGSKITDIRQPGLERIVIVDLESLNELGDMSVKHLIIEIMGKYSNIILTDENMRILDSIRHVSHEVSSVREVLPGKDYVYPPSQNKKDLLRTSYAEFMSLFENASGMKIIPFIYKNYTGISPVMASEISFRANIDKCYVDQLDEKGKKALFDSLISVSEDIINERFSPYLIKESKNGKVIEFSSFYMQQYKSFEEIPYNSVSELLEDFYSEKDNAYHIQQKAHDMRHLVVVNIERCVKKKEIQSKTLKDISSMDKWKLKGELITANIYAIKKGMKKFKAVNYYDKNMSEVEISLDENLTPSENAQRYYNKYNKAKRTLVALEVQKKQNDDELDYLESVLSAIDSSTEESDLDEIKAELVNQGLMKKKSTAKNRGRKIKKSKPLHYISSDGFDIFVGKSNTQNDELTIHTARSNDIWMHTKKIPGSHVIVSTNDTGKAPDKTLEEAANLAAYYSKAKTGTNVPVDYTLRRFVKKPSGAKPGMVIYETNSTIYITPNELAVENMKKSD
ncbi:MAG: NFACT family protein [Clostridia bacterium]|jgi:predicted ribosome quality control (RQC) complex YloA/Tae2 family protein|nr:NFACT family protein [Clostridia bacterium]MCI2013830.1 NFACT family protein [Clostridia bacterium]